jgi:hypothetical protein
VITGTAANSGYTVSSIVPVVTEDQIAYNSALSIGSDQNLTDSLGYISAETYQYFDRSWNTNRVMSDYLTETPFVNGGLDLTQMNTELGGTLLSTDTIVAFGIPEPWTDDVIANTSQADPDQFSFYRDRIWELDGSYDVVLDVYVSGRTFAESSSYYTSSTVLVATGSDDTLTQVNGDGISYGEINGRATTSAVGFVRQRFTLTGINKFQIGHNKRQTFSTGGYDVSFVKIISISPSAVTIYFPLYTQPSTLTSVEIVATADGKDDVVLATVPADGSVVATSITSGTVIDYTHDIKARVLGDAWLGRGTKLITRLERYNLDDFVLRVSD